MEKVEANKDVTVIVKLYVAGFNNFSVESTFVSQLLLRKPEVEVIVNIAHLRP